jgi:hypothetical protein
MNGRSPYCECEPFSNRSWKLADQAHPRCHEATYLKSSVRNVGFCASIEIILKSNSRNIRL